MNGLMQRMEGKRNTAEERLLHISAWVWRSNALSWVEEKASIVSRDEPTLDMVVDALGLQPSDFVDRAVVWREMYV